MDGWAIDAGFLGGVLLGFSVAGSILAVAMARIKGRALWPCAVMGLLLGMVPPALLIYLAVLSLLPDLSVAERRRRAAESAPSIQPPIQVDP